MISILLILFILSNKIQLKNLQLGNGYGFRRADGDAALAVAAIVAGADDGFVAFPLEDFDRANGGAFAAVGAFVVV